MVKRVRWDPAKADANLQKHGISFDEAQTIFLDPFMVYVEDVDHSDSEDRYFAMGETSGHLDWSKAKRGALIKARGPITVTIEPVLAEFFRDEKAVNDALRLLIREGRVGMWSRD